MKLIIAIVVIACVASAAQAQSSGPAEAFFGGFGRGVGSGMPGCYSGYIAGCKTPPPAAQRPRPTSRQVRRSR
jgi:hypothetical protein